MLAACQAVVELVKKLFQGFCGYHVNMLRRCTICSAHIEGLATAVSKTEKDYAELTLQFTELQAKHGKVLQELHDLKGYANGKNFQFAGPTATVGEYLDQKARLQPAPISGHLAQNSNGRDEGYHYKNRHPHPYRGFRKFRGGRGGYPRGKNWSEKPQHEMPEPMATSTPSPSQTNCEQSEKVDLFEAAVKEATKRIEEKMQTSMANTTGTSVANKMDKMDIKTTTKPPKDTDSNATGESALVHDKLVNAGDKTMLNFECFETVPDAPLSPLHKPKFAVDNNKEPADKEV